MTPEIAMWVFGVGLFPFLGFCYAVFSMLRKCKDDTAESLDILKDEKIVEGQKELVDAMDDLSRAVQKSTEDSTKSNGDLSYYIRKLVESQSGKPVPPPDRK